MKDKKEVINYLIFGGLTTLINLICFKLIEWFFGSEVYLINNIICWVVAVCFAFVTNKLWVFESKSWDKKILIPQLVSFVSARVFSLLMEEVGLFVLIDIMFANSFVAKIIMQVVVVVSNYIFSKFIIFKKRDSSKF
jgi:putative flippase GtrA